MSKQTLLLVDNDPAALRTLEIGLKRAGFSVTTSRDGRDALAKVASSEPELIVCDTALPEIDGFAFCKRLKSHPEWSQIPFLFISNDCTVAARTLGVELGAEDYLPKPVFISEVVAQLRILAQRRKRDRLGQHEQNSKVGGLLAEMSIVDILQAVASGRKTGAVSVNGAGPKGAIYFRDGKVIDADWGTIRGERAVYRLLQCADGAFECVFAAVDRADKIALNTEALLAEGMRRIDEWGMLCEQIPPLSTVLSVEYKELAASLAELPDEVNPVLRLFDGRRTISQVVDDSGGDEIAVLSIISKLYFNELLRDMATVPAFAATNATDAKATREALNGWVAREPALVSESASTTDSAGQGPEFTETLIQARMFVGAKAIGHQTNPRLSLTAEPSAPELPAVERWRVEPSSPPLDATAAKPNPDEVLGIAAVPATIVKPARLPGTTSPFETAPHVSIRDGDELKRRAVAHAQPHAQEEVIGGARDDDFDESFFRQSPSRIIPKEDSSLFDKEMLDSERGLSKGKKIAIGACVAAAVLGIVVVLVVKDDSRPGEGGKSGQMSERRIAAEEEPARREAVRVAIPDAERRDAAPVATPLAVDLAARTAIGEGGRVAVRDDSRGEARRPTAELADLARARVDTQSRLEGSDEGQGSLGRIARGVAAVAAQARMATPRPREEARVAHARMRDSEPSEEPARRRVARRGRARARQREAAEVRAADTTAADARGGDARADMRKFLKDAKKLVARKRFKDALGPLEQLSAIQPTAEVSYLLGLAYYELSKETQAISNLESAVRLGTRRGYAYMMLGSLYNSSGKKEKARKAFEKYIELEPRGRFAADAKALLGQ